MFNTTIALTAIAMVISTTSAVEPPPVSLRGSPAAMQHQHHVALDHELEFFHTVAEIEAAVARGELLELHGSEVYEVADFVDLPYLHPAAQLFVTRTAELYYQACGEPLVVTSAVRATAQQPPNAHALSVHPAGMAVDLRVSQQQACRDWLEQKLLSLEEEGVINGIREFRPPHYHVAVYPAQYTMYVGERMAEDAGVETPQEEAAAAAERRNWAVFVAVAFLFLIGLGLLLRRNRGPETAA